MSIDEKYIIYGKCQEVPDVRRETVHGVTLQPDMDRNVTHRLQIFHPQQSTETTSLYNIISE